MHLERARRLATGNAEQLWFCGRLALQGGRIEEACGLLRQSLALTARAGFPCLDAILASAAGRIPEAVIAEKLLPDDLDLLLRVARQRYAAPGDAEAREVIARRIEEQLASGGIAEDRCCYYRAAILALEGQRRRAIAGYTRA